MTDQAILIRVKNAGQLARSQGAVASLAQSVAPETIEAKVYDEMRKKLSSSLKDQGVDAEVSIVSAGGWKPVSGGGSSNTVKYAAFGIGGVALLGCAFYMLGGKKK